MRKRHDSSATRANGQAAANGAAPAESLAAAREAGLCYVSDESPGIGRVRAGRGVSYRGPDGRTVKELATLRRIRRLAIPPAWTDVWICPSPNGHIQATGRDDRGRKQYRYHPDWQAVRDGAKFERAVAFGRVLPRIRRRVARDLARRRLDRRKVLAAMVRLLETTHIRVGNEEYARENHSFGLSTMRDRHVRIGRGTMHFEFRGKGGKRHEIDLHDPRLAAIVRRTQELPGQALFQYLDEHDERQRVASEDVNDYLREIAGGEFSAKDFRTWAGTVLAAVALRESERGATKAATRRALNEAIARVAGELGNTPAVCRKCYIHPTVLQGFVGGVTLPRPRAAARPAAANGVALNEDERAVLALLKRGPPTTEQRLRKSIANARRRKLGSKPPASGARASGA
ncbi:MAG TPA: DNA topoisomerase IB [Opitutus sp.]|nr:DNA topoisomerase IB [Opitutus sp.]